MILDNKFNIKNQVELSKKDSFRFAPFLKSALTSRIDDRTLFIKGIDVSYYYEGYSEYNTEEV
ncbi:MAG: hypothetical protein ACRC6A_00195 [Fusobacteriaceae bacterium]